MYVSQTASHVMSMDSVKAKMAAGKLSAAGQTDGRDLIDGIVYRRVLHTTRTHHDRWCFAPWSTT